MTRVANAGYSSLARAPAIECAATRPCLTALYVHDDEAIQAELAEPFALLRERADLPEFSRRPTVKEHLANRDMIA